MYQQTLPIEIIGAHQKHQSQRDHTTRLHQRSFGQQSSLRPYLYSALVPHIEMSFLTLRAAVFGLIASRRRLEPESCAQLSLQCLPACAHQIRLARTHCRSRACSAHVEGRMENHSTGESSDYRGARWIIGELFCSELSRQIGDGSSARRLVGSTSRGTYHRCSYHRLWSCESDNPGNA